MIMRRAGISGEEDWVPDLKLNGWDAQSENGMVD